MSQVGACAVLDVDGHPRDRRGWTRALGRAAQERAARPLRNFRFGTFAGDIDYIRTSIVPDVLVGKGTPVITWPAPAPIAYSFPVTSTQLNATANVPGTFSYSPSSGTLLPAGERTLSVTFTPTDTVNYNAITATRTLTVNKATPNVVIEGAGSWAYTGSPRAAVGKVKDRFNVVIATPALTYNGSPDPPVMPGEYTVVATFPGNANYDAGSASATLTIAKSTVDIQINVNDAIYDGQPHPAGVTVSGLPPDFFAPDSVTYNGSTDNPVNAGTYTVVATFNGTAIYEAATATRTFVIRKAMPTVTVHGGTFTYNGQPHPATGSVTGIGEAPIGTPTFAYNGGAALPVTVGTYEVVATYAGSANYEPATATTAIAILHATAILDWPLPQTIVYGTPLGQAQLNATANVPGTFTYSPAVGTVLNAGAAQVLTATFTPADSNYSADGIVNTLIDVSKAAPVLNWSQPGAITYGTPLGSTQLNATANVPGTVTYSPAAGSLLNAGASQILTATFTPADSANYSGGSVTATIDVSKATATVTATGGTFTYDGQPHPATGSVTGSNGVSLGTPSFTYDGSAQPPVNAGSHAVVASFVGDVNHEPASATATITIGKGQVVLSWNPPAAIVYGTPLGAPQLNASSNVPGTFAYAPAAGTVLAAGTGHSLTATFIPADAANYTGGSVATSIVVAAAPLSMRANDSAKPFGAPLPAFTASAAGFVNGDTFAALSGALAFATSATAQSAVGTYPVTPSGLSSPNYVITFVTGALTVVRGGVTVSVSTSPAPSGFDQPMTFTANVGAAAPAVGTPGGTVRFFDGAALLGSRALSGGSCIVDDRRPHGRYPHDRSSVRRRRVVRRGLGLGVTHRQQRGRDASHHHRIEPRSLVCWTVGDIDGNARHERRSGQRHGTVLRRRGSARLVRHRVRIGDVHDDGVRRRLACDYGAVPGERERATGDLRRVRASGRIARLEESHLVYDPVRLAEPVRARRQRDADRERHRLQRHAGGDGALHGERPGGRWTGNADDHLRIDRAGNVRAVRSGGRPSHRHGDVSRQQQLQGQYGDRYPARELKHLRRPTRARSRRRSCCWRSRHWRPARFPRAAPPASIRWSR